jgi:ATP-dependent Clp protease ATP-binding subunit ClpA
MKPEIPNWASLDVETPGRLEQLYFDMLRQRIIGQDRAVRRIVQILVASNALDGLFRDMTKPVATLLFCGPSGVGKTWLFRVLAKILFGSYDALVRIDCSDLQQDHEATARLIGAPSGYLGYDNPPYLTQDRIDKWGREKFKSDPKPGKMLQAAKDIIAKLQRELSDLDNRYDKLKNRGVPEGAHEWIALRTEGRNLNKQLKQAEQEEKRLAAVVAEADKYVPGGVPAIVLFDEIEKASPKLFNLLLPVLDDGRLTVNNKNKGGTEVVYFGNTIIGMTSNVARDDIANLIRGIGSYGYVPPGTGEKDIHKKIWGVLLQELEKKFPPEFLGRIGKPNIIGFDLLSADQLREGLDRIIIPQFQTQLSKKYPLELVITEATRRYFVDESSDPKSSTYGMRSLQVNFRDRVVEKIQKLIQKGEEGGILPGSRIRVDARASEDKMRLFFERDDGVQSKPFELDVNSVQAEDKSHPPIALFDIQEE